MTNPQYPGTNPSDYPPAGQSVPGAPTPPPAGWQPTNPPGQPAAPEPPTGKRGNVLTSKPVIGIAALLVGIALGAGSAGGNHNTATGTATVTVTAPAPAASEVTAEDEPSDEPSAEPTEEPTESAAPAPAPEKTSYKTLSARQFKLMVKDPDAYIGKTYVVYGEITQFDSATGTDTFRADTGPKKLRISYGYVDYDQNSFLQGTESKLKKLVEGDCFKAKVTVLGSFSYDTQAGGNTTVPLFQVDSISVYGSTD
jgi:hypothetical protein